MTTPNRRAEFAAKHLRQPTPEEESSIRAQEREDRRADEAARREAELRRSYLGANPGASDEDWRREKIAILARDREEAAIAHRDAPRRAQARSLRSAF